MLYKPQNIWNIYLFENQNDLFSLATNNRNGKVFSPKRKIRTKYYNSTGYADPFLFVDGEWLYLFYEDEKLDAPANICGFRTNNLKKWQNIGVILKEDFHLSFPFTFRIGLNIYMLPETRAKEAVILYKAIKFPYEWERKVILTGDKYVDSSIIRHNNKWFLFTTVWYGNDNGLKVYFSDNIESGWVEHPDSPIHNDIGYSRNGGNVFEYNGKLFRPAQNCTNFYGENVALYEIEKLTTTEYSESKICDLIDKKNSWSKYGGHHFNMVDYKGKKIIVMDGIVNDNWINNHTRKFFNYAHKKFKQ